MLAALTVMAEPSIDAVNEFRTRYYDTEYAYLKSDLSAKHTALDDCEKALLSLEQLSENQAVKMEVRLSRCLLVQRRIKISAKLQDQAGVRRYAADYENLFQPPWPKLGPKWYKDGRLNIDMVVEWADAEDERLLREYESSAPKPNLRT